MELKQLKVTITGIRPLLMVNPRTVDITDTYSIQKRSVNAQMKEARKKNDEDRMQEIAEQQRKLDYISSAYWDAKKCRFFIPDSLILACIKESAKSSRKGKDIDRSVLITEEFIYIETPVDGKNVTFKTLEDSYQFEDEGGSRPFVFGSIGKVPPKTGAAVVLTRVSMPTGWNATFTIEFDHTRISEKTMREIMDNAGSMCGVGGWRPRFGRFICEF